MRGTSYVRGLVVASAALAATAGCDRLPDPEFAAVEGALALTAIEASRSNSGESIGFEFELKNQGVALARACLGPSRSVSSSRGVGYSDIVHHPACLREFAIEPGETMRWHEAMRVSGLPTDRVEVEVEIQVVNPRRCGSAGCPSFQIKSINKREVS